VCPTCYSQCNQIAILSAQTITYKTISAMNKRVTIRSVRITSVLLSVAHTPQPVHCCTAPYTDTTVFTMHTDKVGVVLVKVVTLVRHNDKAHCQLQDEYQGSRSALDD